MRLKMLLIAGLALWSSVALAAPKKDECIAEHVPHAKEVGHGRMTFLGLNLYDAVLYAPGGEYDEEKPFALTLIYLRDFKGNRIADETSSEMKRLGLREDDKSHMWNVLMKNIFPDVAAGDEVTGIYTPEGPTIFCESGRRIGVIKDKDFGEHFFGIWLDDNAKSAALRQQLLGEDHEENNNAGARHVP